MDFLESWQQANRREIEALFTRLRATTYPHAPPAQAEPAAAPRADEVEELSLSLAKALEEKRFAEDARARLESEVAELRAELGALRGELRALAEAQRREDVGSAARDVVLPQLGRMQQEVSELKASLGEKDRGRRELEPPPPRPAPRAAPGDEFDAMKAFCREPRP